MTMGSESQDRLPGWQRWLLYLAAYVCCVGLWLLLVNKATDLQEWGLALIFGAPSVAAAAAYGRVDKVQFRPTLWMVIQGWRIPWQLVVGTGWLLVAIAQQLFTRDGAPSELLVARFDPGQPNDPRDIARRTLAVTYPTVTPNSIILGIVGEQRLLVYHQIHRTGLTPMALNLGAEAGGEG